MKQKKMRFSQSHKTKAIYLNEKKPRSNPRVISNLKDPSPIQRSDCHENKHYLTFPEKELLFQTVPSQYCRCNFVLLVSVKTKKHCKELKRRAEGTLFVHEFQIILQSKSIDSLTAS